MDETDVIRGNADLGVSRILGPDSALESTVAEPTVVIREPGRVPLYMLIKEPLEIGRECGGLLLNDPQISRQHLELRTENGRVVVTDLGSTNGTTLDGQALTQPTHLAPGSTVTMGDTTIQLMANLRSTMISGATPSAEVAAQLRRTSIDIVAEAVAESRPDMSTVRTEHGTITIVFSDIEASTQRADELGDQKWFDLLTTHNAIVRRQVGRHGGTEVKAQGDGFMLTFPSARSAVQCMIEVQRDLTEHSNLHPGQSVRIRVGIHTGEAIAGDDGDLFGKHVNLAARIANEALGAEILVSSLVRQIIEARGDMFFDEPRVAELKGLAGSHTMFPIIWE